jgi:hypothetical protein
VLIIVPPGDQNTTQLPELPPIPAEERSTPQGFDASGGGSTPPKAKVPPKNPQGLLDFLHALNESKDILRGVRDLIKWQSDQEARREESLRHHSFLILLLLISFLAALIIGMSALAYWGKVSGDALLFLVGTVAGWILFTANRYLFRSEASEDESWLSGLF